MLGLSKTLIALESKKSVKALPRILARNLALLRERYAFNHVECMVLALAVCLRIDEVLFQVADDTDRIVNLPHALSLVLNLPTHAISDAIKPGSRLQRLNYLEIGSGQELGGCLRLRRGSFRNLGLRALKNADELVSGILLRAPLSLLLPADYKHLSPGLDVVLALIKDAVSCRRTGVNVLLHGPPGTGKTELVRLIAQSLELPLYEVADVDEDGEALSPAERLRSLAGGQFVLGRRRAIVCFDEVDGIFNDGSVLTGALATAEKQKASFNLLLEHNQVPTFWVANDIHGLNPAFARRFDLVVLLTAPPLKQRQDLLERTCIEIAPAAQLRELARVEQITPAMVTRASNVVRRVGLRNKADSSALLETVLDGVLQAQGQRPLKLALQRVGAGQSAFSPGLCNASDSLDALAEGLATARAGRLCLYGPPGTGKTAFGLWLADRLGVPRMLRRISDIQSPWLGEMERNLAEAFRVAEQDGAILQIDEVDSFLQDRRQASRGWEISQVNEFLTQLDSFNGLFIATTNLMQGLDAAAIRRFDYKVRFDYLTFEQRRELFQQQVAKFGLEVSDSAHLAALQSLDRLTPGDFAVTRRQHAVRPFRSADEIICALRAEQGLKEPESRRIGFIA
jgi:SpoVK/Ycf46/Vps4 family AAA+-type ATPase